MTKSFVLFVVMSLLLGGCFLVAGGKNPALLNPSLAMEKAPAEFRVKVETTKGSFTIRIVREWSPLGADRFYNLVKIGYFKDVAFYRVMDGFMAQFGFSGDPKVNEKWSEHFFKDDPSRVQSNSPGRISFAGRGRHTRSTHLFINTVDNKRLDYMGFTPFGEVEGDGLEVVKNLYSGYGEGAPAGAGPSQGKIEAEGNDYLEKNFPELDYIKKMVIIEEKK